MWDCLISQLVSVWLYRWSFYCCLIQSSTIQTLTIIRLLSCGCLVICDTSSHLAYCIPHSYAPSSQCRSHYVCLYSSAVGLFPLQLLSLYSAGSRSPNPINLRNISLTVFWMLIISTFGKKLTGIVVFSFCFFCFFVITSPAYNTCCFLDCLCAGRCLNVTESNMFLLLWNQSDFVALSRRFNLIWR